MQSVDPLPFIEWSGIRDIQRHRVALPDGGMPVAEHDQQRLPVCLQQYGFWPLAEDSPLYLQDNPAENEILSPHPGAVQARGTDGQQRGAQKERDGYRERDESQSANRQYEAWYYLWNDS